MIDFSDKNRLIFNGVEMSRGCFVQGGKEIQFFPADVAPSASESKPIISTTFDEGQIKDVAPDTPTEVNFYD